MFGKEFAPFLSDLKFPGVDVDTVVASQRKNFETLIEANRRALEGARAVAQRQAELVREGFERATEAATEAMAPTAPEKKFARQAEFAKDVFESSIASYRELFGLATRASEEVMDLVTKRISASFDEMRACTNGAATGAKSASAESTKEVAKR